MLDVVAGAIVAAGGTLAAIKAIDRRRDSGDDAGRKRPTLDDETQEILDDWAGDTPDHPHVHDVPVEAAVPDECPHCGAPIDPEDVCPRDAEPADYGEYRYACSIGTEDDSSLAGHTVVHR